MNTTIIQNVASRYSGVSLASNPAGPATKTAPTKIIKITVKPRINCLKLFPRYRPINSGRLLHHAATKAFPIGNHGSARKYTSQYDPKERSYPKFKPP